jgi:hypothetical protein
LLAIALSHGEKNGKQFGMASDIALTDVENLKIKKMGLFHKWLLEE